MQLPCCLDRDNCSSLQDSPMYECNTYSDLFMAAFKYGSIYFKLLTTVFFPLLQYYFQCIILHNV